jgi:hypothetical protein|tara:strand:- start:5365 stop:5661 length:297 start_codon:yes stop_codon:yes gene_type:complete
MRPNVEEDDEDLQRLKKVKNTISKFQHTDRQLIYEVIEKIEELDDELVKTQEENERLRGGQLINVATNSLVEKLREEKIDLEYENEILRTRVFNRYKQ